MYRLLATVVVAGWFFVAGQPASAQFMGLGDLPGGGIGSRARGVSPDGSVVVGHAASANSAASGTWPSVSEGFRWTLSGGMEPLGDLAGGMFNSEASDLSLGGSVIVGSSVISSTGDRRAFEWTAGSGMQQLAGGIVMNSARGVSADGSVIVGAGASGLGGEGFLWTQSTGAQSLGHLSAGGSQSTVANAVSADGSLAVGRSNSPSGPQAFMWTSGGGMQGLGDLPGGTFNSIATAVSADGMTVVGHSNSALGLEVFRWTPGGAMQGLGDLPGGVFFSLANAVSADGAVVVGTASSALGEQAFIWNSISGMLPLQDVLVSAGFDLTGWSLTTATDISDNGSVIVGYGVNPLGDTEAWVVNIPEPSSLMLAVFGSMGLFGYAWRRRRKLSRR